jgi:peptidoglycan hydrolase-like protein with peptidoglycan-binding domain
MKHTFLSLVLILSFLTPQVHAQTTNANAELIQKLLAQIIILQAELNKLIAARGGNTTTDTTPTCTFTRTLREGTQGTDVTCLQTYLKKKGHFGGTATGYYGPQTKNAVYTWQKSVGIVPEPTAIGMFGPRSQETLIKEMRTTAPGATTNTTPRTTKGGGGGGAPTKNTTDTPRTTQPDRTTVNDTTAPTLPKNLTAIANSSSQITLSWTASTDGGGSGLKGYNIYRVGTTLPLNTTPQTGTTFTHTGLNPATAYTYQIEAVDNAGNKSAKTTSVSKTTLALPTVSDTTKPTTPGQPTASLVTQTTLKLTWTASTDGGGSNLTGYKVFRNGTQIGTPTTNTYSDTNLTANTVYSYTIVSYDGAGNTSPTSTARAVTTLQAVVTPPVTTVPPITTTIPTPAGNGASWNTLCAQSGVFVCDDFSDPTKLKGKINSGASRPVVQNGLLEFTIPTKSQANAGGSYTLTFPSVGEGKFLAFSYRIKADKVATELKAPGRKEFILWRGSSSCTDLELSQTHKGNGNPLLVPYTQCGSGSFGYSTSTPHNIQLHYPDYNCTYQSIKKLPLSKDCAYTHADEWENYYVELNIGTYGQPNSSVTFWKKIDGESTWKRYIATNTFTFRGTGGFNNFMLTVYMTGKDATIDHPEGKVYYDHLIMSTRPFNADQFIGAPINTATQTNTPVVPIATTTPTTTSNPTVPTPVPTPTSTPTISLDFTPRSVQTTAPTSAVSKTSASSLTSQIQGTTPGQWVKVSTDNTAHDVDPAKDPVTNSRYPINPWYHGTSGYGSLWGAWNSGALVPRLGSCGTIVYYGGGHADYFGNAVIGLDLCGGINGAPIWRRLTNPYDPRMPLPWPFPTGAFPDGTPSPAHTYDGIIADPNTSKMMVTVAQGCPGQAADVCGSYPNEYINTLWILDIASRTWNGPYQHNGGRYSSSAWDSKRNLVWFQPAIGSGAPGELTAFNPATKTFTYYGKNRSTNLSTLDHVMGYDPVNDKLVETNFRSAPYAIGEFDPANPTARWKEVVQINKPASLGAQNVLAWSPLRSAWIIWMDTLKNDKVYEVKRTGVNASGTPEYTWSLLTSASNTVTPITTSHVGSYEKYQLINSGGSEILIGQLNPTNGVHAFKIPAPGIVVQPTQVPLTSFKSKTDLLQDLLVQLKALKEEVNKLKD